MARLQLASISLTEFISVLTVIGTFSMYASFYELFEYEFSWLRRRDLICVLMTR